MHPDDVELLSNYGLDELFGEDKVQAEKDTFKDYESTPLEDYDPFDDPFDQAPLPPQQKKKCQNHRGTKKKKKMMQDIPDYDPPEYGEEDKDILLTREKQINPNWDTNKILDKYDLPSRESIENDFYSSSQFYDLLELATKKSNRLKGLKSAVTKQLNKNEITEEEASEMRTKYDTDFKVLEEYKTLLENGKKGKKVQD